jgi:hypothetical protein
MHLQIWSNTQLTDTREMPLDDVVDGFLASRYNRPGVDLTAAVHLFATDQDGPIRGVCDRTTRSTLVTAVTARLNQSVPAGKDPS